MRMSKFYYIISIIILLIVVLVRFYISRPLLDQSPIRVIIPEPSLTADTNSVIKVYNTIEIGTPSPYNISQLYVLGQVAWVNWTEVYYLPREGISEVYHFLQVILTRIGSEGTVPKIYYYNSYVPNDELLKRLIAPGYFSLTYIGSSSGGRVFSYGSMYINFGLNVGALVSLVIPEAPPALSMVNTAVSGSVLTLTVRNDLAILLDVYYSNYSVLYYINGKYYVIPTGVFYLKYYTL